MKPDIFANGGDRGKNNTPESNLCKELGIETIYNIGGGKVRSSSTLVKELTQKKRQNDLEKYRSQLAF